MGAMWTEPATYLSPDPCDTNRMCRLDCNPRGGVPGTARVVRIQEQRLPEDFPAEVLLSFHMRVLLQPLRYGGIFFITRYELLFDDWRGYLIARNVSMTLRHQPA